MNDLSRLNALLSEAPTGICREVHPKDAMYRYAPEHYFKSGEIALRNIKLAMLAATASSPKRILDLPSGYGRVLRVLQAAFPSAEVTACDIQASALEFCVKTFGVKGVLGKEDPDKIKFEGAFDLIWCGSLLTHVCDEEFRKFLQLFERVLAPGGVVVFTVFGRLVVEKRLRKSIGTLSARSDHKTLSFRPEQIPLVLAEYDQTGFGFADSLSVDASGETPVAIPNAIRSRYGDTVCSPSWVCKAVAESAPQLQLLYYTEGGWGKQRNEWGQDVVACEKVSR